MRLFGPKSIKFYVDNFINKNASRFKNKITVDIPAGAGATSELLHKIGAEVHAYDLFPEFFKFDKLKCEKADLSQKLPKFLC